MMSKIVLAFALAVTAITMSIPASANPKPNEGYSSSYQDAAYNRNGW
jgi:hypothetical protein